ncbi:MAG: hypothetical protein KVP17_002912 [Porospora cf. gigantea B]|uniref:uncharacterized protein n=1 Tax=Porospora cf. gigantea B TaxID=2853592 RepID=UPI003571A982|nr:MAG: hypothetical protein KVP17_002912 [Porospora cf. gigantea B]
MELRRDDFSDDSDSPELRGFHTLDQESSCSSDDDRRCYYNYVDTLTPESESSDFDLDDFAIEPVKAKPRVFCFHPHSLNPEVEFRRRLHLPASFFTAREQTTRARPWLLSKPTCLSRFPKLGPTFTAVSSSREGPVTTLFLSPDEPNRQITNLFQTRLLEANPQVIEAQVLPQAPLWLDVHLALQSLYSMEEQAENYANAVLSAAYALQVALGRHITPTPRSVECLCESGETSEQVRVAVPVSHTGNDVFYKTLLPYFHLLAAQGATSSAFFVAKFLYMTSFSEDQDPLHMLIHLAKLAVSSGEVRHFLALNDNFGMAATPSRLDVYHPCWALAIAMLAEAHPEAFISSFRDVSDCEAVETFCGDSGSSPFLDTAFHTGNLTLAELLLARFALLFPGGYEALCQSKGVTATNAWWSYVPSHPAETILIECFLEGLPDKALRLHHVNRMLEALPSRRQLCRQLADRSQPHASLLTYLSRGIRISEFRRSWVLPDCLLEPGASLKMKWQALLAHIHPESNPIVVFFWTIIPWARLDTRGPLLSVSRVMSKIRLQMKKMFFLKGWK